MGYIKVPGGVKYVSGGGGWDAARGVMNPVKSNVKTNADGTTTRVNRSSHNVMDQKDFIKNTASVETEGTGLVDTGTPGSSIAGIDTANIDFGDAEQVKEIQMAIGATVDGEWGPETERLYREQIDMRRKAQGQESYRYGEPVEATGNQDVKSIDTIVPPPARQSTTSYDADGNIMSYGSDGPPIGTETYNTGSAEEEGWGDWFWNKLGY